MTDIKKRVCTNCNKCGHKYITCPQPKASYGTICFRINGQSSDQTASMFKDLVDNTAKVKLKIKQGVLLDSTNLERSIRTFMRYEHQIQFLLVQCKYSRGYMEFIKCLWSISNTEGLLSMFSRMTLTELTALYKSADVPNGLELLWREYWNLQTDEKFKTIKFVHFTQLKRKYIELLKSKKLNIKVLCNYYMNDDNKNEPEWGFPKGRKDMKDGKIETDVACSLRELDEETGVTQVCLLQKVKKVKENVIGTDNVHYVHYYHLGHSDTDVKHDPTKYPSHRSEIGDVGWFTFTQCMAKIAGKHDRRKAILLRIYLFVATRILKDDALKRDITT